MRRKLQGIIACCQEVNASTGTGGGGDRCTEATASMIDCSYRLGPLARTIDLPGANPVAIAQQVMYELTRMLNNGSNISHPESYTWVSNWLHNNGYDKIVTLSDKHLPGFADVKRVIDAGHMAVIGVNDYGQLHLANGTDPYAWPENEHAGHVLVLIGYDDNYNGTGELTVIVDDPLRSDPKGTEVDYSFKSLQAATFADLIEVVGKPFPIVGDPINPPPPAPAPGTNAICVDVSSWQGSIDWPTLHTWLQKQSPDGRSHVIMRASQGSNMLDADFERNWAGAVAAGVDEIVVYHFCYPQDNTPTAEAAWFNSVVKGRLRASDTYMIDFEEQVTQATSAWLLQMASDLKGLTGRVPAVYANLNYVKTRLQDPALAAYPLILADWTYSPTNLPSVPAPFVHMIYVQYSDKGVVPGISGAVDLDVFVGGSIVPAGPIVPQGWTDDGTTLKAPNGIAVVKGFRQFVLNHSWDPKNVPLAPEAVRSPADPNQPALGDGSFQLFMFCELCWSASASEFYGAIGQQVAAVSASDAKLAAAKADLVALVAKL